MKKFGTLPFSGIARCAFISQRILLDLKELNLISENEFKNFFSSIKSITTIFNDKLNSVFKGNITKGEFINSYGHLRPSTYDINSLNYNEAFDHMTDNQSSLLEKSHEQDHSNFTYLNSWSNHYKSWKNNSMFEVLFIRYEDLQKEKENIFKKVILFINKLTNKDLKIDEAKFLNSIKSTNFSNLKNKELNEGFEESVYSNKTGKKINFFNLGFNNRWQKLLPTDIKDLLNKNYVKEFKELNYFDE